MRAPVNERLATIERTATKAKNAFFALFELLPILYAKALKLFKTLNNIFLKIAHPPFKKLQLCNTLPYYYTKRLQNCNLFLKYFKSFYFSAQKNGCTVMMRCRNEGFESSGKDNRYGILQKNLKNTFGGNCNEIII